MDKLKIYKILKWTSLGLAIATYIVTTLFLFLDISNSTIIIMYTIGSVLLLLFAISYIFQIKLEESIKNKKTKEQKENHNELDTRINTIEINEYHNIMQNNVKHNEDDAEELIKAYENFQQKTPAQNTKYKLKTKTITSNEQYFLDIIKKHFSNNYEIRPQVPLSSIIEKNKEHNWEYQNELNRIIDFGLFDKQTTTPLLLIEINDRTHHESKRIYRDQKVKDICEQAGIKLIAFWSEYSNTEQYIVERISKELNSD